MESVDACPAQLEQNIVDIARGKERKGSRQTQGTKASTIALEKLNKTWDIYILQLLWRWA
jgi:hypothetical protein